MIWYLHIIQVIKFYVMAVLFQLMLSELGIVKNTHTDKDLAMKIDLPFN